ncbi:MAG: type II toxin-antitoxin system YafQ family toxin [Butyrivibrio sp.]|nr:type II toxin-antitoxin system YafQ family toxin [Butyrivibrio sp.]
MSRGLDISLIDEVIVLIAEGTNQQRLIEEYDDHELKGNWKGYRECHILPDWLLIYKLDEDVLILSLTRTGSHSDLLGI